MEFNIKDRAGTHIKRAQAWMSTATAEGGQ